MFWKYNFNENKSSDSNFYANRKLKSKRRKRMVDRSKCRRCGVLLTDENCYPRKDTYNHLHCYCKSCYLVIQKERTKRTENSGKRYTLTVNNGTNRVPYQIYFDSMEDKKRFLNDRKLASKCFRSNDTSSGGLQIGGSALYGDPDECEECGGKMRYDENGFLCCEECGLIFDQVVFYRESGVSMLRGRHAWSGNDADEMCVDTYYSTAYCKL